MNGLKTVSAAFVLVGLMIVVGGCCVNPPSRGVAIDHRTDRQLLASVNEASATGDYAAIIDAMAPDYRSSFKSVLMAGKDYSDSLMGLAVTVEEKIGPEPAKRFRDKSQQVYLGLAPRPLEGAASAEGAVDWSKVAILDEGYNWAVLVGGKSTQFDKQYVLVKVKERWYIAPRLDKIAPGVWKSTFDRKAKDLEKDFRDDIKLTDNLKKKIRSGEINKANFQARMSALSAAAGASSQPGAE